MVDFEKGDFKKGEGEVVKGEGKFVKGEGVGDLDRRVGVEGKGNFLQEDCDFEKGCAGDGVVDGDHFPDGFKSSISSNVISSEGLVCAGVDDGSHEGDCEEVIRAADEGGHKGYFFGEVSSAGGSRVPRGALAGVLQGEVSNLTGVSSMPYFGARVLSDDVLAYDGFSVGAHTSNNCLFGSKRDSLRRSLFTSIFIGNIPPLLSVLELKAWFSKFDNVVDSFIPKKKSKINGSRFGFVRFSQEVDALQACEDLDGSLCGGFKVSVNISRIARSPIKPSVGAGMSCGAGVPLPNQVIHTSKSGISESISYAHILKFGLPVSIDHTAAYRFTNLAGLDSNYSTSKLRVPCQILPVGENAEFLEFLCSKSVSACFGSDLSESELRGSWQNENQCLRVNGANFDPIAKELCYRGVTDGKAACGHKVELNRMSLAESEMYSLCDKPSSYNGKVSAVAGVSMRINDVDCSPNSHAIVVDCGVFHLARVSSNTSVASSSSSAEIHTPTVPGKISSFNCALDVSSDGASNLSSNKEVTHLAGSNSDVLKTPITSGSKPALSKEDLRRYASMSSSIISTAMAVCKEAGFDISERNERSIIRSSLSKLLQKARVV